MTSEPASMLVGARKESMSIFKKRKPESTIADKLNSLNESDQNDVLYAVKVIGSAFVAIRSHKWTEGPLKVLQSICMPLIPSLMGAVVSLGSGKEPEIIGRIETITKDVLNWAQERDKLNANQEATRGIAAVGQAVIESTGNGMDNQGSNMVPEAGREK
jgi:hypothetical protein